MHRAKFQPSGEHSIPFFDIYATKRAGVPGRKSDAKRGRLRARVASFAGAYPPIPLRPQALRRQSAARRPGTFPIEGMPAGVRTPQVRLAPLRQRAADGCFLTPPARRQAAPGCSCRAPYLHVRLRRRRTATRHWVYAQPLGGSTRSVVPMLAYRLDLAAKTPPIPPSSSLLQG